MSETESTPERPDVQRSSARDQYFIGVALVLTAITYLSTLRFNFVYDDNGQIADNPLLKSWRYVPQYFTSSVWKHMFPLAAGNYYRPLFVTWLRLNYSLFKTRPLGWHVTSVLLHLLVTWLVYLVVRKMTGRASLGWMTALIFGVHPIHHEVVAWVSGSTESFFAVWFLAAFLAYLCSRERRRNLWVAVSCGLYALALLSKETAIVLPGLIFAHSLIFDKSEAGNELPQYARRLGRAFLWVAAYIPIGLIYLVLRSKVLGGFSHPISNLSVSTWLWTMPSILVFYVKQWFLPMHFSEFYDLFVQARPDFSHVILPGLILVAIAGAIWAARGRFGMRHVGYAMAWVVVPLLPALDIAVFRADELVHDRYFYVPSLGAALFVSLAIEAFGMRRAKAAGQPVRAVVATALAISLLLAVITIRASSYWSDDYTLFTHSNQIAPRNVTVRSNLSVEWMKRGRMDEASTMLEQTLREHPNDWLTTYNFSRLRYLKKEYPEAEKLSRRAIELVPTAADPYMTLGQVQLKSNRLDESLVSMRRAVDLNPYDSRFHTVYGVVLEMSGDCSSAKVQFDAAISLNPGDAFAQREIFRCRASEALKANPVPQPAQP